MNAIIILSGGLDSSVVAYQVKSQNPNKIKCIFYDYGQRTRKQEEFAALPISKNIQAEFIKIDILWLGEISTSLINSEKKVHKTTEKDMENIQREKEDIINWWVPCRNSIFINIALTHAGNYKISSPIINKDKVETVELGNKLNVPFELTYSCYKSEPMKNGKLIHCGYCSNCMQRKKAFYFAGIRDPSEYKN